MSSITFWISLISRSTTAVCLALAKVKLENVVYVVDVRGKNHNMMYGHIWQQMQTIT